MLNPLNFISKFIKSGNKKELDRIGKIVDQINLLEENIKKLNDKEFPEKTVKLKEEIQKGSSASGWSAKAMLENLTRNQKLTNISIPNFDTNQDYFSSPLYTVINTSETASSSKCSNIVIDELFIKS